MGCPAGLCGAGWNKKVHSDTKRGDVDLFSLTLIDMQLPQPKNASNLKSLFEKFQSQMKHQNTGHKSEL